MKVLLPLLYGLVAYATEAEDVSYLRRLRKLTSPAMIWTSKPLDYTVLEDEDVTDIEEILQNLETAIEKRQRDAKVAPFLVIYSLDERTTTESFAEGREFMNELPNFMKKGSTHMYPHCLARKKKPNTSQWAAILDSLESELPKASEARLAVISDAEVPGMKKNGVKYLDHSVKDHKFDQILKSMANSKVLVIEATIDSYPEGGWIHHIDNLVGSTERDVILLMAVTSPLPGGAIHGLLPFEHKGGENAKVSRTDTDTLESLTLPTLATPGSTFLHEGIEEGTGAVGHEHDTDSDLEDKVSTTWDEDEMSSEVDVIGSGEADVVYSSTDGFKGRRLQATVRASDEEPVVLRIKPSQLSMIMFILAFGVAIFIAVSCMHGISTPNMYLDKAPPINKEF